MAVTVKRSTFKPTADLAFKVSILAAEGMSIQDIAGATGLAPPMIEKYFSEELKNGKNNLKLRILELLYKKAAKGNIGAQRFLATRLMNDGSAPMRPRRLGKKEARKIQAEIGHEESEWGELIN